MSQFAVVTGGAAGIGLEIVRQLASPSMGVAILDIDGARAEVAAKELRDSARAIAIACDVSDLSSVQAAADQIHAEGGRVTHLVSNAGWGPNQRFLDTSIEEQDRIIDVNFRGTLNVCRIFVPDMVDDGWGRVVLIGSDAGRVGTPKEAVYAGTKAGILGFAKSLAIEVSRNNITVNVVSPGSTDTGFIQQILTEEQLERRVKGNPMGRLGTPADVADAVSFFCSDQASYISGQVLSVNGGIVRLG